MSQTKTLAEFLDRYNDHPVITIDVEATDGPRQQQSPFIVVRCGDKVAIVNPLGFSDHLCLDVHSFVAGDDATAGVFGMTNGHQWNLGGKTRPSVTGTTSHGWPSAGLVAVLIGEQEEVNNEDS